MFFQENVFAAGKNRVYFAAVEMGRLAGPEAGLRRGGSALRFEIVWFGFSAGQSRLGFAKSGAGVCEDSAGGRFVGVCG